MAFNNGFPVTYPQYYPQFQMQQPVMQQPVQQPVPAPQPQNSNLIWVQGEAGAKSYLVAPNTTVQLWDSEKQSIYLKSADATGMPSMKILDYTIRDTTPSNASVTAPMAPPKNAIDYATKADVDALYAHLMALKDEVESMAPRKTVSKKKEAGTDE